MEAATFGFHISTADSTAAGRKFKETIDDFVAAHRTATVQSCSMTTIALADSETQRKLGQPDGMLFGVIFYQE